MLCARSVCLLIASSTLDRLACNAGNGEAVDGCVQLVRRALRRASQSAAIVFHLPRLETWAVHYASGPAAADDSQADATSPAAQGAAEHGLGHASRSPYRCGHLSSDEGCI